ncbi:MAG: hypothetical protein KDN19_00335 [Verrucomicrobiae bacterium]|nr:hypothetical protein [Verrucomicrobiae bacterium]
MKPKPKLHSLSSPRASVETCRCHPRSAFRQPIRISLSLLILSLLAVALATPRAALAQRFTPEVTKLHGRATNGQTDYNFGHAVAVSERWLLVGEPYNSDVASDAGAAHLYDARIGRYLRKLTADDGNGFDYFGSSVALCGNLAVVGARNEDGGGAVYGYDARTGRFLWKLESQQADESFGTAVALSGHTLLVGAPRATDEAESEAGRAYLYDLSGPVPVLVQTLGRAADAEPNARFGSSVALCGQLALVGCPDSFPGGTAYLFDTATGARLREWAGNNYFGTSVALDAGRVVVATVHSQVQVFDALTGAEADFSPIAAPGLEDASNALAVNGNHLLIGEIGVDPGSGTATGGAHLYDLSTGQLLRTLTAGDGTAYDHFGWAVALCGNRALIGARNDGDLGDASGAAYYHRDVAGALPLEILSQAGDFAPGVVDADFRAFGDAAINSEGEVVFPATLRGSGAGRGTTAAGLWTDQATGGSLNLLARGGTDLGGMMMNATGRPIFNRPDDLVFSGTLKGAGVTGANDAAIFHSNAGGVPGIALREGDTHATANGAVFNRFHEVVQCHIAGLGDLGVAFQYKFGPGGVNRTRDSGVLGVNHDGTIRQPVFDEDRELASMPGTAWAQFLPRVARPGIYMTWSAFLRNGDVTPADNLGAFAATPGFSNEILLSRRGDPMSGGTISNFLGEVVTRSAIIKTYLRATLRGVPGRENEVLFDGTGQEVWKKGDPANTFAPALADGVKVVRLLKFWAIDNFKVIYLAKLAGPGVNGSNDCVLLFSDFDGVPTTQILLREGDDTCGNDCPRIGVIQRVDVEPDTGKYVVLASLTGNRSANQALFTGDASAGDGADLKALRLPIQVMRKGTVYQAPTGETTRLLSMILPDTTDRGGVGAKGGPQVIDSSGKMVMCLQFTNRAKVLVKGKP